MTDPRPEDRPAADPQAAAEPGAPAPETASAPASESQQAAPVDPRPRPAYGEYAPEGWSWTPPEEQGSAVPATPATAPAAPPSVTPPVVPVSGQAGPQAEAEVPTRLPGVPHNLGAPSGGRGAAPTAHGVAAPAPTSAPPAQHVPGQHAPGQQTPAQQHAPAPHGAHAHQPAPAQAPLPQQPPQPQAKPRTADRLITIFLLVIGAYGALSMAFELYRFPLSQRTTAEMLGISDYTPPAWLEPVGIVCAIVVLALYAVNLILSVRRMRANKLTFFVPLIAGVVAFLLFLVIAIAAVAASPEFLQASQDPAAISKLLENMRTPSPN